MPEAKTWSRPDSVPVPQVWRKFEGAKPLPNGQVLKIRVQDFTEDLREEVVEHMAQNFLRDEPICAHQNLVDDPVAIEELRAFWHEFLGHKLALVALLENKDELEDKTLPYLVGCNITALSVPNEPKAQLKSASASRVLAIVEKCHHQVDCFKHYQVSEYLYALGLSVHPRYRGQAIGLEILKSRFDLCRAVGLKLTVTVFTAIASQKLADKAGFETLAEIIYEDYKDENGEAIYKGMATKSLKLMAAKVD